MTPFLLDHEIAQMVYPLTQPAAQKRYLDKIGVPYTARPDGRPLVSREFVAQRLARMQGGGATEPDTTAFKALMAGRTQARRRG